MSKRIAACVVSSLVLILVAMAVWAQPGPDRERPDRPDGPPGPRFGGPFGPPGGGHASPAALLAMPEVQKELAITEKQREEINELQLDVQQRMQKVFESLGPPPFDAEPEEMQKHFAAVREKFEVVNRSVEQAAADFLKPEQMDRLRQLRLQREGALAMARPEIARKLDLSDEQLEKLREFQGGGFGPPRMDPQATADALKLFTAAQRDRWNEMTGKSFSFPEPRGFGGPGGPGGFGPGRSERKLVSQFDENGDGWLNREERIPARDEAKQGGRPFSGGRFPGGPGGPGGRSPGGREHVEGKPGPKVSPSEVEPIPDAPLYEANVVRTLFLDFENNDWEAELADFHNTDVEVPCTLTVDGKAYKNVGVHFRGMSSYGMVPAGSKRSLNVSLDFVDDKQRLYGYKTLNLLNAHEDPSLLHTVLYSHIARQYLPAPKANFVRVVINGESWGLYVNVQQFDKIFAKENFGGKAARWKVSGSPGGGGGLVYTGDKLDDYKRRYEIKSDDKPEDWQALIKLCKTLNETPPDQLEAALEPMLDIESTLWFLALDNALINCDGYWIRASDYNLLRDEKGKFHLVPHDMNEAFQPPMGPGFGGGPGGRGPRGPEGRGPEGRGPEGRDRDERRPERPAGGPAPGPGNFALDPLVGLNDSSKPLRSKLLAVPSLRERYLKCVRTIAEESLDWKKLGPVVERYAERIDDEVKADTRKLTSYEAFERAVSTAGSGERPEDRRHPSLYAFARERRKYLLEHPETKKLQHENE